MANQISVEVRTNKLSHELPRPQTVHEADCSWRHSKLANQTLYARSKSAQVSGRYSKKAQQFASDEINDERERVRYTCHSSWPVKKSPAPPWQTSLDGPVELCVRTPTYSLTRSRSRIFVDLREPSNLSTDQQTTVLRSHENDKTAMQKTGRLHKEYDLSAWFKSDRDSVLDDLQKKIDSLNEQLQAERTAHALTKQFTDKELREKLNRLQQNNANELRALEAENSDRLLDLTEELTTALKQSQKLAAIAENNVAREIETTEAMFITYKSKLHCASTYAKKLQDFNDQCSVELQSRLKDLNSELMSKRQKDLENQESLYQQQIHQLHDEHNKQLKDLANRYSESEEHQVRLSTAEEQIKTLEEELSKKEDKYNEMYQEIEECQAQNNELQRHLDCFKISLDDKIRQIDNRYKGTLTNLTSNLVAVRRLYLKKCEQVDSLVESVNEIDANIPVYNDIKDTIKVLVETRIRSDVSFTDQSADDSGRRFSH